MMARLEAAGTLQRLADTMPRMLERMEMLEVMLGAFDRAGQEAARAPRAAGGFGGLWRMVRDPDNQDALRFLLNIGKELRAGAQRR
jgi:uncharacterized protein YjgD (DUF1641 family)